MNRFLLVLPLLAITALSAHADTYVDTARVRSVQPQYETVAVPRQECSSQWINETQRVEDQRSYGGAVIGGVAGAVLGNQLGRGHGREAATALGAVVGAFTGDRVANRDRAERYEQVPRQVQTCQMVNDVQQRLTGYQVGYEYRGQQFVALMPQDPGRELQVRVSVEPLPR
ncbi:MAG: glycine zipper 2TM domain-containing protein [Burkholderiaceae bacterium]